MVSNNQIVCTGRKIISQLKKSTVRFSFLTLHFNLHSISRTKTVVLLVCMEWFQGSSCSLNIALPRCFPKASAKVRQKFEPANIFEDFFKKSREKIKHTGKICAIDINSRQTNDKKSSTTVPVCFAKNLIFF